MQPVETIPSVAIACGGTGGHLFPGLAIGEELTRRGCTVSLIISPKEVDQQAVQSAVGMEVLTLPSVGLANRRIAAFFRGFVLSCRTARRQFKASRPHAVLAMGGFTGAPAVLAGLRVGAATFIHESNSIPGRANRWLAPLVDAAFIAFPDAARRLRCKRIKITGTPVRSRFQSGKCSGHGAPDLDAALPALLIMGGSQGAEGINDLITRSLPGFSARCPSLQFLHLTGSRDCQRVADAYARHNLKAVVRPFLTEMEQALATAAVSRAGASSLAELAAMRVPALLIPFPAAADNHQFYNAWAFVESGAARMLEQERASPDVLIKMVAGLIENAEQRDTIKKSLARWHQSDAAERIAAEIFDTLARKGMNVPAITRARGDHPAPPPGSRPVEMETATVT